MRVCVGIGLIKTWLGRPGDSIVEGGPSFHDTETVSKNVGTGAASPGVSASAL